MRALACGLAAQGLKRGDHLALVGDNRPRLYCGDVPRPSAWARSRCRSTRTRWPPRWRSPIQNAEIALAVVEDQEQVDKLLEILPHCPTLKHIYYDDPRGLRHYAQPRAA